MKSIVLLDITVLPGFIKKVRDMAVKAKEEGKTIFEIRAMVMRMINETKISNARVIKHVKGNSRWRMKKRALSLMIPY